jgi:hypothetical protein
VASNEAGSGSGARLAGPSLGHRGWDASPPGGQADVVECLALLMARVPQDLPPLLGQLESDAAPVGLGRDTLDEPMLDAGSDEPAHGRPLHRERGGGSVDAQQTVCLLDDGQQQVSSDIGSGDRRVHGDARRPTAQSGERRSNGLQQLVVVSPGDRGVLALGHHTSKKYVR